MTESSVDPSSFRPFEVTAVHIIYVGLGFFIVLFGMFSLFIKERLYLGEAPIAAIFGIIVGPACLDLFSPTKWGNNHSGAPGGEITNEITLEVLRVTVALSVFAVGVELPKKYLLRHWKSIAFLLGPVMVWGWLVTAAFMYALIPGLDFLNSLVVASCVTPTDPILAQAVVGGPWAEKHVPAHLRHVLMCESGCNDGAAFPFLYLALFLTTNRDNHGKAIAEWFYDAWAYQIIFGTLLGAMIGWAARKLMRFSERHKLVDRESFVAQYVSLAIASMGVNVLLGSDDLLAAFACGTAFAWDGWFTKQTEDSNFSSIIDLLFNIAVFIYIGALMPFRSWVGGTDLEPNTLSLWRLFVLAICVLLTKRLPIVVLLWRWIPDIKTFREAIFAGHFGPIGVGAIFIATLARIELPEHIPSPPESSNDVLALVVQPIIFFFVACSILVHGLTIPFFAFSKGASRMTRTWSRNPSFAAFDTEPGWVSRMRKRTGENLQSEEGNMTEIERVLNAQLRQIGKGAIGGDAEKELTTQTDTHGSGGSGSSSSNDAARPRAQDDTDHDAYEWPQHEDPMGEEWDGDDTVEMRRYREKQRAKKEAEYAELRQRQQGHDAKSSEELDEKQWDHKEGDVGAARMMDEERGAMDRDIPKTRAEKQEEQAEGKEARKDDEGRHRWGTETKPSHQPASSASSTEQEREHAKIREECEDHYPKSRSWVEGDQLVIEYQKSRLSEVETHTLPILENERESIASSDAPAHAWAVQHADALEHYAGLENAKSWSPTEAMHHLVHNSIPKRYQNAIASRRKRRNSDEETKEARDARFSALYGGMTYASARRHDDDDDATKGNDLQQQQKQRPRQPRVTYEEPSSSDYTGDSMLLPSAGSRRSRATRESKSSRERTPSPPVTGWLAPRAKAPRVGAAAGPGPSRRRGGARSPRRSISPQGSASPAQDSFGGVLRLGPKKHRYASDARRRNTTKKLVSGQLSLCPNQERYAEEMEEHLDPSGREFERSASLGGLSVSGGEGSVPTSGRRSLFSGHSASSTLLAIPRTLTGSSTESGSMSFTGSSRRPGTLRRRADDDSNKQSHSRSSSMQWLDVNDAGVSERESPSARRTGTQASQRPPSPSRLRLDLARIGGGITRPSSRAASPTRSNARNGGDGVAEVDAQQPPTTPQQSTPSTPTQALAGTPYKQRRSRFGTLLSSLASGHSPGAAFDSARRQNSQGGGGGGGGADGLPSAVQNQTSADQTPAVWNESTPSVIVGAGEYPQRETGGILADHQSNSASANASTASSMRTPRQGEEGNGNGSAIDRGVTFNL